MPRTLNPLVEGSSPSRPTNEIKGIGPLGTEYFPASDWDGAGTKPKSLDEILFGPKFVKALEMMYPAKPVPTGANQAVQLDLFPEIRHPGL